MILLDTNVISEILNAQPAGVVQDWFQANQSLGLGLTSVTQAEILTGIALLPTGRRKKLLEVEVAGVFDEFEGRVLPFDESAARRYSIVAARRRAMGRPISAFDAMIAAIAYTRDCPLATRNTRDFQHCDLRLINRWNV